MVDRVDLGLRAGPVDYGLSAMKALLSLGPGGGFVAELISAVLPEQRADRMARYVTALAERLNQVEALASGKGIAGLGGEQVSLFHAGGEAAVKAPQPERVERIAKVVAEGILGSDLAAAQARRMVDLLSELSDDDVVQLCSHVAPFKDDPDWRERHGEILWTMEHVDHLRARRTPHDVISRRSAAIDLQIFRLISRGLLEEPPQFDLHDVAARLDAFQRDQGLARYGTGNPALSSEPSDIGIANLGTMVLMELGLLPPPPSSMPSTGKEWDAMDAAREGDDPSD